MIRRILLILLLTFLLGPGARAWVYPEHREITRSAILKLDSARRSLLDQLWSQARKGFESRTAVSVIDDQPQLHYQYLDYAAWPAIGGDHSVSAQDMLNNILKTEWIFNVADITARLRTGLDEARNRSERQTRLRDSDIRLLRADPEYVSRAGGNNGHFMMARPEVNTLPSAYFDSCFMEGAPLNTNGIYKWYHASALMKARILATASLTPEERSALALAALADEAFALHFLEDCFASGHVAGIWGDASQRKGTHDYYNEMGLEVTTWQGERLVLMGDAYMRSEDETRAAASIYLSLVQFLDAASGLIAFPVNLQGKEIRQPEDFNTGKTIDMPPRQIDSVIDTLVDRIQETTPVPGLARGLGQRPRFRSEIGPFIGIAPAARFSVLTGGFFPYQNTAGVVPGLELGLRVGLGMEGVMNESGDGLIFLDLGWRLDGSSSMSLENDPFLKQFGAMFAAIPSRDAFYGRIRLPFYLIPCDLIILAPLLYIVNPAAMNKVVATAGNGGLIPWQTGLITPIGRFQFILGREIGICLYGSGKSLDAYLWENPDDEDDEILISMHSTQLEFPFLEYRPMRTFSSRQSASLVLQFYAGLDIPGKRKVTFPPDAPYPDVRTTWFAGVRLAFDWRYYLAKKEPK